eukprot:GGOE01065303.1.p1 GENE.GGOE01065303.1~~GGOE01065303.1.p1  ORF type:complete len:463 (-),score=143.25 GGOE01065303.1:90-1436(-)
MAEIHSKVFFYGVQGGLKEIRRTCHQHAELGIWPEAMATFCGLLGHDSLRLEYEDTEKDRVVLESQEEWEECLRAGPYTTANPLRLHITKRKVAKAEKDSSTKCHAEHRKRSAKDSDESLAAAQPEASQEGHSLADSSSSSESGDASAIVRRYISITDTAAIPAEWVAGAFTRTPSRDPRDVELDVNLDVFAVCLAQKALTLMEAHDHAKALQLLQDAFALRPRLETIYNVGCCQALLGHTAEAFQALETAVAMGFAGADHLLQDSDLASLRGDERFLALAKQLQRSELPDEDQACSRLDATPPLTPAEVPEVARKEVQFDVPPAADADAVVCAEAVAEAPLGPSPDAAPENPEVEVVQGVPEVGRPVSPSGRSEEGIDVLEWETIGSQHADDTAAPLMEELADEQRDALYKLHELGFTNDEANLKALVAGGWSVRNAIDGLLEPSAL